jgi:hypothetical protein
LLVSGLAGAAVGVSILGAGAATAVVVADDIELLLSDFVVLSLPPLLPHAVIRTTIEHASMLILIIFIILFFLVGYVRLYCK